MITRAEREKVVRDLRDEGLLMREIGERLGLSVKTISDYLNDPGGKRCRARKESYRGACVDCGAATNGSNGRGSNAPKRCQACSNVVSAERKREEFAGYRRMVEEMWAEGMTGRQMADALGWTARNPNRYISDLRSRGYNLPHRRTPEQIERILVGSDARLAKARRTWQQMREAA